LDRLLSRDPEAIRLALHPDARAGAFDPKQRLLDMDREGIAVSVNFPTSLLLLGQLPTSVATELSRAYNSWFSATYNSLDRDRLKAMALVPLGDASAAVAETRRAIGELGAPGVAVSPYAGDLHLDDPSLDPLWAVLQELGAPVAVHGGRATTAPHLLGSSFRDEKRYYAMAHPFGQMMAMGDLVLGGVLDRFPRLRVVFLESGVGWIPWYIDRLDEAFESVDPGAGPTVAIARKPSEYLLGGNCYFSCEPDEPNLSTTVDYLGEDQVIFASDYPHFDCDFPNTVTAIRQSGLSTTVLRKVTLDNPARLYQL
jgi:predicted TIM-barrel fold metal-dependent hydrolase